MQEIFLMFIVFRALEVQAIIYCVHYNKTNQHLKIADINFFKKKLSLPFESITKNYILFILGRRLNITFLE